MDAVQQRRMAHSSWSAEHQEEEREKLENEDEFSSPPPTITTTKQTTVQLSITDATTRKTVDANYRLTQEPKRSEDSSHLLRQQKKASNKAGIPTSLTSKASERISNLFLLSLITLLIDNQHRLAWWASFCIKVKYIHIETLSFLSCVHVNRRLIKIMTEFLLPFTFVFLFPFCI